MFKICLTSHNPNFFYFLRRVFIFCTTITCVLKVQITNMTLESKFKVKLLKVCLTACNTNSFHFLSVLIFDTINACCMLVTTKVSK